MHPEGNYTSVTHHNLISGVSLRNCLWLQVPASLAGCDDVADVDVKAGKDIFADLKQVCNTGVMPSFENAGGLTYYTLQNLVQRSQKATAALLLDEARPVLEALYFCEPTRSRSPPHLDFQGCLWQIACGCRPTPPKYPSGGGWRRPRF